MQSGKWNKTWRISLAVIVALIAASSLAFAQSKLIVQIGNLAASPNLSDLFVAEKAGFFSQEGLDVEVRYSANASQSAQIVASGGADIARLSYEPLLLGYDKGLRAKIFYGFYTRFMYFAALSQDSPIASVADLRGKKVSVSNIGSASILVLNSMLRTAGLQANDVTLIPGGVGELPMNMLRTKQVDALMLYSSYYATLTAAGMPLRFLYHPAVADFGNNGYIATDRTIAQKRDLIGKFSRAVAKATVFIFANPEAAVKMYWQANPSGKIGASDQEAMARSLGELVNCLKDFDVANTPSGRFGDLDMDRFASYMEMMLQEGAIDKRVAIADLVTRDFLGPANDFDPDSIREAARAWK